MAKGLSTIYVYWSDPYTAPPEDVETLDDGRTLWACSILDRSVEREVQAVHAPVFKPGSGWSFGWSPIWPERKKWSPERKAQTRRTRLRRRLDKKFPLFAEMFEAQEVRHRPAYFDAAAIQAGVDLCPGQMPVAKPNPRRLARINRPEPSSSAVQLDFLAQLDATAKPSPRPPRHLSAPTVAAVASSWARKTGRQVWPEDLGQATFDIIDPEHIPAFLLRPGSPLLRSTRSGAHE